MKIKKGGETTGMVIVITVKFSNGKIKNIKKEIYILKSKSKNFW